VLPTTHFAKNAKPAFFLTTSSAELAESTCPQREENSNEYDKVYFSRRRDYGGFSGFYNNCERGADRKPALGRRPYSVCFGVCCCAISVVTLEKRENSNGRRDEWI